jgi:hypothetical protein
VLDVDEFKEVAENFQLLNISQMKESIGQQLGDIKKFRKIVKEVEKIEKMGFMDF